MDKLKLPKTLDFGFGELTEVSYLEQVFKIKRRSAIKYLKVLRIKPVYIGGDFFFSLSTFKRILFVLCRPGGPGFCFPGSKAKNNPRNCNNKGILTEVTARVLEAAAEPKLLAEMAAASGNHPDILKKFLTNSPGRPRKKTNENDS